MGIEAPEIRNLIWGCKQCCIFLCPLVSRLPSLRVCWEALSKQDAVKTMQLPDFLFDVRLSAKLEGKKAESKTMKAKQYPWHPPTKVGVLYPGGPGWLVCLGIWRTPMWRGLTIGYEQYVSFRSARPVHGTDDIGSMERDIKGKTTYRFLSIWERLVCWCGGEPVSIWIQMIGSYCSRWAYYSSIVFKECPPNSSSRRIHRWRRCFSPASESHAARWMQFPVITRLRGTVVPEITKWCACHSPDVARWISPYVSRLVFTLMLSKHERSPGTSEKVSSSCVQ